MRAEAMKRLVALLLPMLLPAMLYAQAPQGGQPKPLVLTHLTIIDVTSGRANPDMTLVVEGARITAVGKGGRVKVPPGAQIRDASGKYLIPGLWDMHAHALTDK